MPEIIPALIVPLSKESIEYAKQAIKIWSKTTNNEEVFNNPPVNAYQDHFRKQEIVRTGLEHGAVPLVGNGFSFIIDTRPPGHENDYIPADEYTLYFSKGQIPLAAPGHKLFDHDIGHVASYQTMFSSKLLATTVRTAALNSLGNPVKCQKFTKAMDGLGDCMRNLQNTHAFSEAPFIGDVNGAAWNLQGLLSLCPPSQYDNPIDSLQQFTKLSEHLDLPYYRSIAKSRHETGRTFSINYETSELSQANQISLDSWRICLE